MAQANTYTEILSRAISDFDSIFAAFKAKLITVDGSIITDANLSDGSMPTQNYAGYITNQLYRVGNVEEDGSNKTITAVTPQLVGGAIASYAGYTPTTTDATANGSSNSKINLQVAIPAAGYYDTTTTLNTALAYNDIAITTSNISDYSSAGQYVIKNTDDAPMLQVSMAHGSVNISYEAGAQSISNKNITGTVTLDSNSSTVTGAILDPSDENPYSSGYFTIGLKRNASFTATGTIVPTKTVNAGYVLEGDVTAATPSFTIAESMSETPSTIYIPEGTISASLGSDADISVTGGAILGLTTTQPQGTNGTDYYAITAATSDLDVLGTTTAGYVASGSNVALGTVSDLSKTYYIPGTTVGNTTVALSSSELTNNDPNGMVSPTETGHSITYSVSAQRTTSYGTGFLEAGSYNVAASGSKTIYIKEGAVNTTTTITQGTLTGDTSIITRGSSSGAYSITLPITAVAKAPAASITAGYIDSASQITHTGDSETLEFSVAHGNATVTPTLSASLVDTDDGKAGSAQNDTIFHDTLPSSGDYYTITASATTVINQGYIKEQDVTTGAAKKLYLKKAKVTYVQAMGDNEQSFLEVTSGGYLPSGTIVNIAEIDTVNGNERDNALVHIGFNNANSILTAADDRLTGKSYYTVSASKLSTTDAGFISASYGAVEGTTYIAHGNEALSTSFVSTALGTISALDTTHQTYNLPLTTTITNSLAFNEGYIKAADVTLNGEAGASQKTVTGNTSINIAAGAFGVTNKNFSVTATHSSGLAILSSGTSSYSITPALAGTVDIGVTSSGYVKEGDQTATLNVGADANAISATTYYVKAGTGPVQRQGYDSAADWTTAATTPTNIDTINLNSNFSDNSITGAYTVTLSGKTPASITLAEGYYGSSEKQLSGTVRLSKTLSVAHGHSSVSLNASDNSIVATQGTSGSGASVQLLSSAAAGDSNYIRLDASVKVDSTTTLTEGYVKNVSGDKTEATTIQPRITRYIKAVGLTTTTTTIAHDITTTENNIANNTTVYGNFTIGSNTGDISEASSYATTSNSETGLREAVIIPTAGKYALYDTKVVLTPNARLCRVKIIDDTVTAIIHDLQ